MRSIISLFWEDVDILASLHELSEAGYDERNIRTLSDVRSIRELLHVQPTEIVKRYTVWGMLAGIAVYAVFALFAAFCQCNLLHFGQAFGAGAFVGGILAGALVGGGIGLLVGLAEAESDSHLYVQGARNGGQVLVVNVLAEKADEVALILRHGNARGVRLI